MGHSLIGRLRFVDAYIDEWLVVACISYLTENGVLEGKWYGTVWDQDGFFVLAEAADVLPEWMNESMDVLGHVWLHNQGVIICPMPADPNAWMNHGVVSQRIPYLLGRIAGGEIKAHPETSAVVKKKIQEIESGLKRGEWMHRGRVAVNKELEKVLAWPTLVARIVHAFAQTGGKPMILKSQTVDAAESLESLDFCAEKTKTIMLDATKTQWAQLYWCGIEVEGEQVDKAESNDKVESPAPLSANELGRRLHVGFCAWKRRCESWLGSLFVSFPTKATGLALYKEWADRIKETGMDIDNQEAQAFVLLVQVLSGGTVRSYPSAENEESWDWLVVADSELDAQVAAFKRDVVDDLEAFFEKESGYRGVDDDVEGKSKREESSDDVCWKPGQVETFQPLPIVLNGEKMMQLLQETMGVDGAFANVFADDDTFEEEAEDTREALSALGIDEISDAEARLSLFCSKMESPLGLDPTLFLHKGA